MANKLFLNHSGGMNRKASALIIKDEECELAINYHLDKVGALTKRKGYSRFASQPTADKTTYGLGQFNDMSGDTVEQLFVQNNAGDTQGVIYYNNGGTWTAAKSDDTASKKSRFISFIDYVFRANGADVIASSANGSSWGTTNSPATITPKYGAVFQDRVYFANGNSSNRSRFWFSSLPSSGSITWSTGTDWVDVNPDDGDQITGLENNGNRLLIFKNRALYRWTFGQVEADRLIGVGTSSSESIKTNLDVGITFFANPNGIYAYSGGRPRLLSRKIDDIIKAVTDWTEVYAEVDEDHYYLSVGNISLEGRTYSNVVLCYHISLDAWTMYTTATPVRFMARLIESGVVENIYFGSTTGRTYKFLDTNADDGSDIAAYFRSKEFVLGYPQAVDVEHVDVFAATRGNTSVMMDTNRYGQPITLGSLVDRITNLRPTDFRKLNSTRIYLVDNSTVPAIIEGFNFTFTNAIRRDEQSKRRRKAND